MRFKNYNNSKKKSLILGTLKRYLATLERAATASLIISVIRQIGFTCSAPEIFLYSPHNSKTLICFSVGTWNHAPLPEDPVLAGGHADRLEGWRGHDREAGQEQAEAVVPRNGRKIGKRVASRQIRRMLGSDSGKI